MTDTTTDATELSQKLVDEARTKVGASASASDLWSELQTMLSPDMPFEVHQQAYQTCYGGDIDVRPAWIPTKESIAKTNIQKMMIKKGFSSYQEFYDWSIGKNTRDAFWMESMENVGIEWETKPRKAFDTIDGPAHATYFPNGRLNIADSCFNKRNENEPALYYSMESDPKSLQTMSFGVLDQLSNRIANGITTKLNLEPGSSIGVCMPMTPESIAIYLGIVKSGCVVVSIADSFSAEEIAMRCRLGNAKAVFTQDVIFRGAKFLPLFGRVLEADKIIQKEQQQRQDTQSSECCDDSKETKSDSGDSESMKIIVLPGLLHSGSYKKCDDAEDGSTWDDEDENGNLIPIHESVVSMMRQDHDASWYDLLHMCSAVYVSVKRDSMDPCNILFSSGTTGEPKAIVWSHSTPIKCAIDGHYHQDIQEGDRVAWPTNIGWMMGPWLLFQLMNGASVGLFNGITSTHAFCEFVEIAEITMLGVVPSLVKAWKARGATENCDWSRIRKFSSTGEASDPVTYLWLMSRVPGFAPVIEYCGGTEIGGSFLSSTLVQPNVPSMFSSPVLGSEVLMMDSAGKIMESCTYGPGEDCSSSGEIVLVPPSVGLSTKLLNRNHYDVYYAGMPTGPQGQTLRKHGDEIEYVRSCAHLSKTEQIETAPYLRALGRCDDTMNIGGIKVGSVEIERVCNLIPEIQETAAIAVSGPNGGPSRLVIYVVLGTDVDGKSLDKTALQASMLKSIKTKLNPLFGITDTVVTDSLPRTASNKVMRRLLRDDYMKSQVC